MVCKTMAYNGSKRVLAVLIFIVACYFFNGLSFLDQTTLA